MEKPGVDSYQDEIKLTHLSCIHFHKVVNCDILENQGGEWFTNQWHNIDKFTKVFVMHNPTSYPCMYEGNSLQNMTHQIGSCIAQKREN